MVSSDVRTHQLEIPYSAPDEEVLYEEYPSRMECCVDPDEDVPDLVSDEGIPDLVHMKTMKPKNRKLTKILT